MLPKMYLASFDLGFDLWITAVVTQWAVTIVRACQVWLKFAWQFLKYLAKKDFGYLFRPHLTSPFDLLIARVDRFMPSLCVPLDIKVGSFVVRSSITEDVWRVRLRTYCLRLPVWPRRCVINENENQHLKSFGILKQHWRICQCKWLCVFAGKSWRGCMISTKITFCRSLQRPGSILLWLVSV